METMKDKLLSIVIPVFNEVEVLPVMKRRLDEVVSNIGIPVEVLMIDDGSKDKSAVEAVKQINDDRVIIIDNKDNRGKREAQKCAFDIIPRDIELFVTIDSVTGDTPLLINREGFIDFIEIFVIKRGKPIFINTHIITHYFNFNPAHFH